MADRTEAKIQGLRLSLPGAPSTFHTVPGVPGYYHPDIPAPVGGDGELTLDDAKTYAADESIHLELVKLTAATAERSRAAIAEFRAATRGDLVRRVRDAREGRESTVAREELIQAATTTAKEG